MNVTVYCGSQLGSDPSFEECAVDMGRWIVEHGHTLVYGGGGVGLMGVVSQTVLEGGGRAVGVIPRFLMNREKPSYQLSELHVTETMWERKQDMVELGDMFVALPGGAGTLEEISEVASLAKLGRAKPCILINCNGYYDRLCAFYDDMVEHGFLAASDRQCLMSVSDISELDSILAARAAALA
jgi:uncharacterized protein (TIGR00730 family)